MQHLEIQQLGFSFSLKLIGNVGSLNFLDFVWNPKNTREKNTKKNDFFIYDFTVKNIYIKKSNTIQINQNFVIFFYFLVLI